MHGDQSLIHTGLFIDFCFLGHITAYLEGGARDRVTWLVNPRFKPTPASGR
jgi:hypothetical protein